MSQQENPQDPQADPSAPAADAWSIVPPSNRPAEGATRVDSLNQAEQTWKAGDGATDFLGLEQDPGAAPPAATPGAGSEANPTQAWLFHMENQARASSEAQAQLAEPAAELADGLEAPAATESPLDDEFASSVEGAPQGLAPEFAGELGGELEPGLASEVEEALAPTKRSGKWLVAAGVLAVLGVGGWQFWNSRTKQETTVVVDAPGSRGGHKNAKPKPTPSGEKPAENPKVAQPPSGEQPQPGNPTAPESNPVAVAPSKPEPQAPAQPESAPSEGPWGQQPAKPAGEQPVAQSNPGSEPAAPDLSPVPFAGDEPAEALSGLATPRGTRRPAAQEIAGLWTAQSIPLDAIAADALLYTPRVGAVRLLMKNGEHLQGRLHSVGQGRVCVDIALGRMTVDNSDVSEIVQIMESDLTKKPSGGLPEETAGLLYVSAKVPGGYLTGWLVQRREGQLTLITEQAKKVTIPDDGFEPISKGRARVVGALDPNAAEAGSSAPAKQPDTSTPKLQRGPPAANTGAAGKQAPKPAPKPAAKPAPKPGAQSPAKPAAGAVKPKG